MYTQNPKIEDDNLRQFDQVQYRSVNVKNARLIGPELQYLSSLLRSSEGFGHY